MWRNILYINRAENTEKVGTEGHEEEGKHELRYMYENVIMKTIILHANWNIISKIKDVAREMAQRLKWFAYIPSTREVKTEGPRNKLASQISQVSELWVQMGEPALVYEV